MDITPKPEHRHSSAYGADLERTDARGCGRVGSGRKGRRMGPGVDRSEGRDFDSKHTRLSGNLILELYLDLHDTTLPVRHSVATRHISYQRWYQRWSRRWSVHYLLLGVYGYRTAPLPSPSPAPYYCLLYPARRVPVGRARERGPQRCARARRRLVREYHPPPLPTHYPHN